MKFVGVSEGGIQTAVSMPQYGITFDIGRGSSKLVEIPRILLTHGHLDHSAGVAYHISQRSLRHLPPGEIYCPASIAEPLDEILQLWSRIEEFQFQYTLIPVDFETLYPLQGNFHFRALPTDHRVASCAYAFIEKRKKLKSEFRTLTGPEIARLKKERGDLFYDEETPLATFSGDTKIEFLLGSELARRSKVLFLECTYIDEKRPVERARKWGHIHLDEIVEHAEAFRQVERLYLIHFSSRYPRETILETLKRKLPGWLWERTVPFL